MQLNLGKEGPKIGGSDPGQATPSDSINQMVPNILVPTAPEELREMMEDLLKRTVPEVILTTVPQVMKTVEDWVNTKFSEMVLNVVPQLLPIMEDSFRKVVKEEIQSFKEGNLDGNNWASTNVAALPKNRNLHLKFFEAPDDVLTGKEIKAKGGTPITVAIFDEAGQVIQSGPESSAKVEILFLEANEDDEEDSWSHEDFNNKIIEESEKKKPHFPKKYHVYLEEGIGTLSNAKLANGSDWTKSCKCRLGARVVENFSGARVKEAWTEPFVVSDSRGQLHRKHYPPSLSDDVWRLDYIGRDGEPCKRLKMNNVLTVEDFLFLRSINLPKLKSIIGARDSAWNVIEKHAESCSINDKRMRLYTDSSEPNIRVVFDIVGKLMGVIRDSQYVQNDRLSEAEKVRASELLCSAFEHRDRITIASDEETLKQQYPCQASNALPHAFTLGGAPAGFNPTINSSGQAEDPKLLSASASECWVNINSNEGNPPPDDFIVLSKSETPLDSPMPNPHDPTSSNLNLARESGVGDPTFPNTDVDMVEEALSQARSCPIFSPFQSIFSFQDDTHNPHGSTERQPDAPISAPNSGEEQMTETRAGGYGGNYPIFPLWIMDDHRMDYVMHSCRQRRVLWLFTRFCKIS